MDERIVEFITALRSAGVRVSVAESADALRALEQIGLFDRDLFRASLQATLVKDQGSVPEFSRLFPLYFGQDAPPPMQQPGSGSDSQMSDAERQMLEQMLEEMLRNMTPEQLAQLMESMMKGQQMSRQELRAMLDQLGPPRMSNSYYQDRMTKQALEGLEFDRLSELLQELLEKLREAGMSEEALAELAEMAQQNMQSLRQQIGQQVGQQMREQADEEQRNRDTSELLDRDFDRIGYNDEDLIRGLIAKLASQIRARAALRQRRANTGTLDAKATIRANMRYGGVPIDIKQRKKHLKPKVAVICDLSISMRPVVSFMLMLVYAMQDQISRTRSFAFIDDMHDISIDFNELRPEQAIESVLARIRPPRNYSTDLGRSLETFTRDHLGFVDRRTTVIILGDGRNNYYDPGLRHLETIKRRARKLIWFNPEQRYMWGTGDSDMLLYEPVCDGVHVVRNLRQLGAAIDSLFTRR
jgi:uncharacterized protein with von Willebrand factor type A (vWA) domain